MTTIKQEKAFEELLKNGGNVSRAMVEAGYSPASAKNPKVLTDALGFKELCEKVGLTDKLIINSLTKDIKAKPRNRVQELALAAKIKGLITDKSENKNWNINMSLSELFEKSENDNK